MTWIVLGIILMSSLYPIHLAVSYFHILYTSAQGSTNRERYRHYRVSFTALGQLVLVVALVMCAWGVADVYIPESVGPRDGWEARPNTGP